VISVALLALALWAVRREGPSAPAVYDAVLPDSAAVSFGVTLSNVAYGEPLRSLSISPAGDFAVYAAREGDSTELWYRSLRNSDARRLPGTRGGNAPRISPDGNRVAFLRADRVMLLSLSGGEPRLVLDGRSTDALGWMSNTQISAVTNNGNRFNWIDAEGGTPRAKTIPHCNFGRWVPELRQVLCSYNWTASVLDPESGAAENIRVARPDGTAGELLAGTAFFLIDRHHLVYITGNGSLVGARYDPERRLAFRPVSLLGGIRREALGEAQVDIASNGTLVYAPGVDATIGRLVTLHAGGTPEPLPMESAVFQRFDLSHDRRWMAASVQGTESNELRIYDLQNGQHFTWFRAGWIRHPLWSAGGDQLLFSVRDSTRWTILRGAPSSGVRPDTLATTAFDYFSSLDPTDYDDDHLALAQSWGGSIVTRFDPSAPHPSFDTVLTGARFSSLSPNRKLILYQTLEGNQVLVTGFPVAGRRWQLASEGVEPLWLSGTDVLYRVGNAMLRASTRAVTSPPGVTVMCGWIMGLESPPHEAIGRALGPVYCTARSSIHLRPQLLEPVQHDHQVARDIRRVGALNHQEPPVRGGVVQAVAGVAFEVVAGGQAGDDARGCRCGAAPKVHAQDAGAIQAPEEELAAIGSPQRLGAPVGAQLPLGRVGIGEGPKVDLIPPGLVGHVGQPASVGREGREEFIERLGQHRPGERILADAKGQDVVGPDSDAHHQPAPVARGFRVVDVPVELEQQRIVPAAVRRHSPDGGAALAQRYVGDQAPVGCPGRRGVVVAREGEPGHRAAVELLDPDVAATAGFDDYRRAPAVGCKRKPLELPVPGPGRVDGSHRAVPVDP
jgi:hypothetical protein